MNWLLIIVGIVLLIGAVNGFAKGAIKILVSLVTTVVTIAVVFWVTPYVSQAVIALTPLDEVIESQCMKMVTKMAESVLEGQELAETEGIIDVDELELSRSMQITAIENAELPDVFKELLLSNNNSEVYAYLGVTNFVDYIATYLAKLIIDILSFLITFMVVTIVVRAIVFALDFVAELPVLGILNRLSGACVGAVMSLIIIWFAFVIITLFYSTSAGETLMQMIVNDKWLLLIYKMNPIMKIITMFR